MQLLSFSSVQSLSCVRLFATPWIAACQASLSITSSQSLLKLMSIESVMPSSHLILCHPLLLLLPIPPSINPSKIISDSLQPWGLQHARLPCPSVSPRDGSNSCPLSRWCHLIISSSVIPFSFVFNLSQHWDLSNKSALHIRWPKYWIW